MIRLSDFRRIVFFTGAGLSVESGIPTYRGSGGIWHEYNYADYACQRAFDRDPERVWEFHDKRRAAVAACEPNAGHRLIAQVAGATIVTQNIDGLHQRAGSPDAIELHGSLWRVRCDACRTRNENHDLPIERRCACGSWLRPDIVWFEDVLDHGVLAQAEQAASTCDLFVGVGTSGVVFPAAALPRVALEAGATCLEINPEPTPVSDWYGHHLRGPASAMLAKLIADSDPLTT